VLAVCGFWLLLTGIQPAFTGLKNPETQIARVTKFAAEFVALREIIRNIYIFMIFSRQIQIKI
jgi:hypothetical protein